MVAGTIRSDIVSSRIYLGEGAKSHVCLKGTAMFRSEHRAVVFCGVYCNVM